jgi:glycyl-tRNA synthetase
MWWKRFVENRLDVVGIDAALIMNPKVWEASGHVATFSDPLVDCKKCKERFRADQIDISAPCPNCKAKDQFTEPRQFNLMLKTFLGPSEEKANVAYFRPETAQGMFVDFKLVAEAMRLTPPFGIAQMGKAFRNEITPGNFIFRTREFEQMEIEYFIPVPRSDQDWQMAFEDWRIAMHEWMHDIGLPAEHIHELEVPKEELAHYSRRTIDFEYDFPFGKKELYGLAYRTDFDLSNHMKASGQKLVARDPQSNEEYVPHCIEPTWGVDRTFLAVMCAAYREDEEKKRVWLSLPPHLAPYKAAVFPLLANKPDLVAKAKELHSSLQKEFTVALDDRGNIGKRYFAQDEIGTPYCITVDFQTLEDNTVTVRDRDSATQERMSIDKIAEFLRNKIAG